MDGWVDRMQARPGVRSLERDPHGQTDWRGGASPRGSYKIWGDAVVPSP